MKTTNLHTVFNHYANEIIKSNNFKKIDNFTQHGTTSCFWHSIAVAYYSLKIINFLGIKCDIKSLIKGALLHDYFLYDWHNNNSSRWHGFKHPKIALKNANKDYGLTKIEKNIIQRHMFPLTFIPPKHKESIIVCIADKLCSIYETFYKANPYSNLKNLLT